MSSTAPAPTETKKRMLKQGLGAMHQVGLSLILVDMQRMRLADDELVTVNWRRFDFQTLESDDQKGRVQQLTKMIQAVEHRRFPILVLRVATDVSADGFAFMRLVGMSPGKSAFVYGNFIPVTPDDNFQPIFKVNVERRANDSLFPPFQDGSDEFTPRNQYPVPVSSILGYFKSVVQLPFLVGENHSQEEEDRNLALPLLRTFLRLFRKNPDKIPAACSGSAQVKASRYRRWARADEARRREAEVEFADSDD